jgi:DNA-binding MarR family transcriptional regulator
MKKADAEVQSLYESVCTLLRILTVGEKTFAPAGGRIKYNGLDFQTIGFVGRAPGCMATELAQFLDVAATTATSTVDRLVKRGLLLRNRPEDNRRAVALSLSPLGQEVFDSMVAQDMQNMALMLQVLSKPERAPFVAAMQKITAKFAELGQTTMDASEPSAPKKHVTR